MKLYLRAGRALLRCPEGHVEAQFVWQAGSEHADHHRRELRCDCGKALVHQGGHDPWAVEWVEVEGEPHLDGRVE